MPTETTPAQAIMTTVLRTRTQTTETVSTANASYTLEVVRKNGVLDTVAVHVSYATESTAPDGAPTVSYQDVGSLNWAKGEITAVGFPLATDTAAIITDINAIIAYLQNKEA